MRKIIACTNKGKVRSENQDSYTVIDDDLFCIADGMGGHEYGFIAARTMTSIIEKHIDAIRIALKSEDADDIGSLIKVMIGYADNKIRTFNILNRSNSGTTVLIWAIHKGNIIYSWAGDTKLYEITSKYIKRITRDHTVAQTKIERGQADFVIQSDYHILTRCVGCGLEAGVQSGVISLREEDVVIFACSDGYDVIPDQEKFAMFQQYEDLNIFLDNLNAAVESAGSPDNYTAIIHSLSPNPKKGGG